MLKLIVGVKGTGKTKMLIDMVNAAIAATDGAVACIEKGGKLIHEIKHQARLLDVDEYCVETPESIYGFIAGIFASNHDVTHIYIDSLLKICGNDIDAFEKLMLKIAKFGDVNSIDFVITSSMPAEDVPEALKSYIYKG